MTASLFLYPVSRASAWPYSVISLSLSAGGLCLGCWHWAADFILASATVPAFAESIRLDFLLS